MNLAKEDIPVLLDALREYCESILPSVLRQVGSGSNPNAIAIRDAVEARRTHAMVIRTRISHSLREDLKPAEASNPAPPSPPKPQPATMPFRKVKK